MTRSGMRLDERGWQQLAAATRKWLREAERIEETASKRLDKSGDPATDGAAGAFDVGLVLMLFEGRPVADGNADGAVPGNSAASRARLG
jgi:hypothetical protein